MRCDPCPVPCDRPCLGETSRFAAFCTWAASGDPVKVRHVVNRSAIALAPPVVAADDREVIERRRAGKLRLNLGEKAPEPTPGTR